MIQLLEAPLNAAAAHAEFVAEHGHHGAVAAFTGVVRGESGALVWPRGRLLRTLRERRQTEGMLSCGLIRPD